MTTPRFPSTLSLGVALVLIASVSLAKDKPVSLQDCPAPVQTVIAHYSKQGTLEVIGLDTNEGSPVYEAKFTLPDGERYEVHMEEDGKVRKFEKKKPKKK